MINKSTLKRVVFKSSIKMQNIVTLQFCYNKLNDVLFVINTAWVLAQLCRLKKGCTRLAAASDKVYQLLAQGRWFSPGTPASSTTKTGRHDIAEILLKVALSTNIQIQIQILFVIMAKVLLPPLIGSHSRFCLFYLGPFVFLLPVTFGLGKYHISWNDRISILPLVENALRRVVLRDVVYPCNTTLCFGGRG
jgi:hypothetical protein